MICQQIFLDKKAKRLKGLIKGEFGEKLAIINKRVKLKE